MLCTKLKLLQETAAKMDEEGYPEMFDGSPHWSGTKSHIEEVLGRKLDSSELTCLSLSRYFGPTPLLTEEESKKVMKRLWPNGNPSGLYIEWSDLAEKLNDC